MGALGVFHAGSGPAPESTGHDMSRVVPHRGDDTEVRALGSTVLAVTRQKGSNLDSIVADDGMLVAFVGVLDNREELDRALGRSQAAEPPASTIAAAFGEWGSAAVTRLRGSFAGAVTDGRTVRVFRDQFGTKPLFRRSDGRGFYAATEIKQVLAGASVGREPDAAGLEDVLFGTVGERTAVTGVERIGRGTIVSVGVEAAAPRRYWDPEPLLENNAAGVEEATEAVRDLLRRAVERCVTADATVLLSGGFDSPSIAALAADRHRTVYGHPLAALSAVYPNHPSVDERELVELVSSQLGLDLSTYSPNAGVLDDVEHWVDLADGPTDTLSLPQAAEAYLRARELGSGTVVTGEMAEYVFEIRHYLLDHLISHGRFGAAARVISQQHRRGRRSWSITKDIIRAVLPPRLATSYARIRRTDPRRLPSWVDPHRVGGGTSRPDLARSAKRRWTEMQIAPFLGAAYTFEADEICAASCGVTVRWPFADIDLWEFVLGLRAETKFPDIERKSLARRSMRGLLPPAVIDRRSKTTFDEYSLSKAEYDVIRRLVLDTDYHVRGINYERLAERLERGDFDLVELTWARDLARVHAFVRVCS